MEDYETGVSKLPIFKQIHAEGKDEDVAEIKLNASDCGEFTSEEIGSSDSTNGSTEEHSMEFEIQEFYLSD